MLHWCSPDMLYTIKIGNRGPASDPVLQTRCNLKPLLVTLVFWQSRDSGTAVAFASEEFCSRGLVTACTVLVLTVQWYTLSEWWVKAFPKYLDYHHKYIICPTVKTTYRYMHILVSILFWIWHQLVSVLVWGEISSKWDIIKQWIRGILLPEIRNHVW